MLDHVFHANIIAYCQQNLYILLIHFQGYDFSSKQRNKTFFYRFVHIYGANIKKFKFFCAVMFIVAQKF